MLTFTRYDAGWLTGAGMMVAYSYLRPSYPFWPFVVASIVTGFLGKYLAEKYLSK